MKSINIIAILIFIISNTFGQTGLEAFLEAVEKNNQELLAAKNLRDAAKIETRTDINPDNPFVEYGYLPGSNELLGTKTLFAVNQEFQFPTVYTTKRKIADKQSDVIDGHYRKVRHDILLKAKLLYYQYVFLRKQETEYSYRLNNAKRVYNSYQEKLESGNASVLESNKAKILYISIKGKLQLTKQELRSTEKELSLVNGGSNLQLTENNYKVETLYSLDSIKSEFTELSPEIATSKETIEASRLKTNLSKQNWLPEFQIGYEAESEPDGTYSGLRAGISIPLWKDKNKVKLAQANYLYSQSVSYAKERELVNFIEKKYQEASEYEKILKELEETLIGTSDLEFIEQAFNAGQISIIEYILELSIFYEITDMYLETEKGFYHTLSELYSYKL